MDALILSSRYGRLKIVAAKLLAGFIVTFSWVTLFTEFAHCWPVYRSASWAGMPR